MTPTTATTMPEFSDMAYDDTPAPPLKKRKQDRVVTHPRRKPRRRLAEPTSSLFGLVRNAETNAHVASTAERLALALQHGTRHTYDGRAFFERSPTRFLTTLRSPWWPSVRRLHALHPPSDLHDVDLASPYAVTAGGDAVVVGTDALHMDCRDNVASVSLGKRSGVTSVALHDGGLVALACHGAHFCNAVLARPVTLEVGYADAAGFRATGMQLYNGCVHMKARAFSEISATRFLPCGGSPLLAVGNRIGSVRLWEMRSGRKCVLSIEADAHDAPSVTDIQGQGHLVYVSRMGDIEHNLAMWDLRMTGNGPFVTYEGHRNCSTSLKFDVHGGLLVAGGDRKVVRVWDAGRGGMPLATLPFSHDVEEVCIGGVDKEGGWAGGLCVKTVCGQVQVCGLPMSYVGGKKGREKKARW